MTLLSRIAELEAALPEARLHIPVNEFYVAIHTKLARVLEGEKEK
jgi:hypothetical protein